MTNNPYIQNQGAYRVPAKRRSAMKVVLATFACLIALFVGLLVLLLIGVETGPVGLFVGMVAATLPVPFYLPYGLIAMKANRSGCWPPHSSGAR